MMAECDPTDGEPEKGGGDLTPEANFLNSEVPAVLFEKTRPVPSLGLSLNPGAAVRISDSTESVLTELEADGSGEEALLLPGPAGNLSPRAGREKRTRRNRHSSSSDNLASPGELYELDITYNLIKPAQTIGVFTHFDTFCFSSLTKYIVLMYICFSAIFQVCKKQFYVSTFKQNKIHPIYEK